MRVLGGKPGDAELLSSRAAKALISFLFLPMSCCSCPVRCASSPHAGARGSRFFHRSGGGTGSESSEDEDQAERVRRGLKREKFCLIRAAPNEFCRIAEQRRELEKVLKWEEEQRYVLPCRLRCCLS